MGRRAQLAPWLALLLLGGCARNNPEFGLGSGGTVGDSDGDSRADDSPTTRGGDGDTTGGGDGAATAGTTDAISPETGTSEGGTDDGNRDSSETGTRLPCEKIPIGALSDTFVDGTGTCTGSCAGLNFGGAPARRVGRAGLEGPSSVYLIELEPTVISATVYVESARLHVPLTTEPQAGATAMVLPVSLDVFHGVANGTPEPGASTWNHQVSMDQMWAEPSGGGSASHFGIVLAWAAEAGVLIENQMTLDDLIESEGAPYWAEIDLPPQLLTALQANLSAGADIRFGFSVDSLDAEWIVRTLESDGMAAHLDVEVCE